MEFDVKFEVEPTDFDISFDNGNEEFNMEVEDVYYVQVAADHNRLPNRNLPNQHPISAITGLTERLNSFVSIGEQLIIDGNGVDDE